MTVPAQPDRPITPAPVERVVVLFDRNTTASTSALIDGTLAFHVPANADARGIFQAVLHARATLDPVALADARRDFPAALLLSEAVEAQQGEDPVETAPVVTRLRREGRRWKALAAANAAATAFLALEIADVIAVL